MERPKDRDFVETEEGLLFCVVGYLHPPDRYTAYLKYAPSGEGKWRRGETSYRRVIPYYHVSQVEDTYDLLRELYPQYLHLCPVRNITVSSVPRASVREYYCPRERLQEILEGPRDDLEWKLNDLTTILCGLSGLDSGDLGVTGSLLTRSHNSAFSDMDITVYGLEASRRLKETILETRREESAIQPFNAAKKRVWSDSRAGRFPLSTGELMEFAERRWNYGVLSDTYFSIHPVRIDEEITEEYGDNIYEQSGEVEGVGVVSDASESIYLPAIYGLEDVKLEEAGPSDIERIVSFEGLFCDMFRSGERVEFRGILERVSGKENHHRVVIGGAGSRPSFIKRVS
jgi:predicted nucleotidyltransferase